MAVTPGDIYWLHADDPDGEPPRIAHPHLVIRVDAPDTVEVCALTTNARKISMPGNILLDAGEGSLPKASIVEVSKRQTVPVSRLGAYVGRLAPEYLAQVLAGIRLVDRSFR